jgi:hypothetical protein
MSNIMEMIAEKAITELARRSQSNRYFSHPDLWAREMLGEDEGTLWSKQIEIGDSVVKNKSTAVKAGHGVGKSFLVAVLTCWWIDTRYPDVFVASTAPSQKQIGAIVWREIRRIKTVIDARYKAGEISHTLPGYITADNEWKVDGGTILGFGRKPPDNKTDDSFQGIHAEYVLAIGDEAVGLTRDMLDALGNITSNENSRRITIANPTNPGSEFATFFKEDKGWSLHTISVFDSPNFTEERHHLPAKMLAKLTGPSYVEERKKDYGEGSPRYRARVEGEFAWDLGDTLIKPEDIACAVDTERFVGTSTPTVLGVDIARFGADKSVVYKNENGAVRFVASWEHAPVTESAERVHRAAVDTNATEVRIDGSGIGGGVIDILMQREDATYTIIDMNPNAQSPERKKWHNARAWWWDSFRAALRSGNIDLDPEDENYERVTDELQSVEYKFNSQSGGLLVESKDDMKKRGQKSPDFADAAIYSSADMEYLDNVTAEPGDRLRADPEAFLAEMLDLMPGYLSLMRSL